MDVVDRNDMKGYHCMIDNAPTHIPTKFRDRAEVTNAYIFHLILRS
jgi:hypothetical protein